MSDFQQISQGNTVILYDAEVFPTATTSLFSVSYWRAQNALAGNAAGRGTTYFFTYQKQHYVLRHYRRGGLIGKLLNDPYMYTGLAQTRAWQEINLLRRMHDMALPTPVPVAAMVTRKGLYYQADIITQRIPDSTDVHHILQHRALDESQWQHIGETIRQLHDKQIFHHDLNIHNIMLDGNHQAWIIDFDKCAEKSGEHWKAQNLQRLLRSLHKEQQLNGPYYWHSSDWQALLNGYHKKSHTGHTRVAKN